VQRSSCLGEGFVLGYRQQGIKLADVHTH